jgi:alpha-galactosidase
MSCSSNVAVSALLAAMLALQSGLTAQTPARIRAVSVAGFDVDLLGDLNGFALDTSTKHVADGIEVLTLSLTSAQARAPRPLTLKWRLPSHDVAGHWMTSRGQTKTIRPDWAGSRLQASMLAREAPVSCLFSSDNKNVLTFAVSDAINTVQLGSGVREEDGFIYNDVILFTEPHKTLTSYTVDLRVDRRPVGYEAALRDVAAWWAAMPAYTPAAPPEPARMPVYSTWYNFHQSIDAAELLKELAIASPLGFTSIIVDDGWQTKDSSRGYAFTGDWQPERMPDMKAFVDGAHRLGVRVVLWYAVPFVGKNATAAERFKDKSLRFDDRLGAYVLDPRYPEVRQYLIDIYTRAVRDWDLDGFKLDFIERLVADDKTVLDATNGRDYASVNEAADRLMTDIMRALAQIKRDIMIEFRQAYIGPLMRKYGNMFRASDSPNAYVANRVKTIDLRLLSGTTAVHADMIMWHENEPVEAAALQYLNVLFSVPQVSVKLQQIPRDHLAMVKFYTDYWIANRAVLLDGDIDAPFPTSNYPIVRAKTRDKQIIALYTDEIVRVVDATAAIDIVNGKRSREVVLSLDRDLGSYHYEVRDCQGRVVKSGLAQLAKGVTAFDVPPSGLVAFTRSAGL